MKTKLLFFMLFIIFEGIAFSNLNPIQQALKDDDPKYCDYIVQRGDNINVALLTAAQSLKFTIVKTLIEKGANVNYKDDQGFSPLHRVACITGEFEMCCKIGKFLIEHEANVNNKRNPGFVSRLGGNNTPLHEAVAARNLLMVKLLIENGADVNANNDEKVTPIYYAANSPNPAFVEYLISKGANVNSQSNDPECPTPIFNAAVDHIKTLEVLIKNGADLKIKNTKGLNVLEWAERINRPSVVKFLWPYFHPGKEYTPKAKPVKGMPPFWNK